MGKVLLSLLVCCLLFIDPLCHAQTSMEVSDPRLEIRDNILYISYDILNSDHSDKFEVSISITDAEGDKINATAFEGDIGEGVNGGKDKHITWNPEKDNIFLNADIFIQINAILVPGKNNKFSEVEALNKNYNKTVIVLQSVAFPGWGLSRINRGQPHWIKGIVGYGCIAGSIIYYGKAKTTFEDYLSPGSVQEARSLYASSVRQDNISEVLAYAAIGIWVSDIIWTVVGVSRMQGDTFSGNFRGISMGASLEMLSQVPMLSFRYQF